MFLVESYKRRRKKAVFCMALKFAGRSDAGALVNLRDGFKPASQPNYCGGSTS